MSDPRPIGIFDSGLGGLTVAKEIYRVLPNESTVYIGDTARVPYGNRSPETVTAFSREMIEFLLEKDVKAIVIACATASSVALKTLQQEYPHIPIIGVVEPAAKRALEITTTGTIGIIGTQTTIQSKSFEQIIKNNLQTLACPLLVPILEEGNITGPVIESVIDQYLNRLDTDSLSTLILGCTHYPLVAPLIQQRLPNTKLINVGIPTAHTLKQMLNESQSLNDNSTPSHLYFATDVTENFSRTASIFLKSDIVVEQHHLKS